ncbi:MAG: hypothetical protein GXP55_13365 [Deltaproteobacteria bacterium]|nr:hypothetical protein [Deltaproteobacteria bacterium]
MTRTVPSLLMAVALGLAPRPAAAQFTSGNITLTLFQVMEDGVVTRTSDTDLGKALNGIQCDNAANVMLNFTTNNVPSAILFLDLWVGTPSEDCSVTESRTPGDRRICSHLPQDPVIDATDGSFSVSLADLIAGSTACDTGGSEVSLFLWALATGESETTGDITTAQYGFVQFAVDPTPPAAPVPNETASSGDTAISITWPAVGEIDVTYRAYVDTASGSCEATTLVAGAPAPVDVTGIISRRTGSDARSISLNGASLGLTDRQSAAVAITAVDANDNESPISQIVCITRVPTAGFCDVYAADTGESCPQGCSVSPPGTSPSPLPLLVPFALIALGLSRRRSRR